MIQIVELNVSISSLFFFFLLLPFRYKILKAFVGVRNNPQKSWFYCHIYYLQFHYPFSPTPTTKKFPLHHTAPASNDYHGGGNNHHFLLRSWRRPRKTTLRLRYAAGYLIGAANDTPSSVRARCVRDLGKGWGWGQALSARDSGWDNYDKPGCSVDDWSDVEASRQPLGGGMLCGIWWRWENAETL